MVYGWGSKWFLRYLGPKELVGSVHASVSTFESGFSNCNFSCKTICQYLAYLFFRTISSAGREKESGQNFGDFGHALRPALESKILSFKTLLHNFTSISTMSLTFRTVVTEVSAVQNLDRKIGRRSRRRRRRAKKNQILHFVRET